MNIVNNPDYRAKVYGLVKQIPPGRVMTYGQIAIILGEGYTARTIGYVMHAASTQSVPWQRVINSKGICSTEKFTSPISLQQDLLQQEGILFSEKGICNLNIYRWFPENLEIEEQPNLFGE
jgi:methylated-DNA-protein-cysteine methyltransferase related protein